MLKPTKPQTENEKSMELVNNKLTDIVYSQTFNRLHNPENEYIQNRNNEIAIRMKDAFKSIEEYENNIENKDVNQYENFFKFNEMLEKIVASNKNFIDHQDKLYYEEYNKIKQEVKSKIINLLHNI